MTQVVEPPEDKPRQRANTNSRYPWEKWNDGQWRLAERGVDYQISDAGFRSCVYDYARRNGMEAETRKEDRGIVFRMIKA